MRVLRPFVWAAVLVAGFLYVTSVAQWDVGALLQPVGNAGRMWTEPASAATAGVLHGRRAEQYRYLSHGQATPR